MVAIILAVNRNKPRITHRMILSHPMSKLMRFLKMTIFTLECVLIFIACSQPDFENKKKSKHPRLIFQSGFEPNSSVVVRNIEDFDFIGEDLSVPSPNFWNSIEFEPGKNLYTSINCGSQNVNDTSRSSEIVAHPADPANKVLRFWGKYPNEGNGLKFRMQADFYSAKVGFDTLFYKIKMYLPSDFNVLKNLASTFSWFTIMEFWNNSTPKEEMFRITVDLKKINKGQDSLRFGLRTEKYNTGLSSFDRITNNTNNDFMVSVGKWMNIEINIVEGDEQTGKFYMAVTPEGENKNVIFNYNLLTHHPDIVPSGIKYFSPFKFYTYGYLIDTFRNAGKTGQIYWDDFEIWSDSITYSIE
jgi:hypothetical protein